MNISDVKEAIECLDHTHKSTVWCGNYDRAFQTALELLTLYSEGKICEVVTVENGLIQELIDNCQASLAETDISDQKKAYRKDLFERAKALVDKIPAHRYTEEVKELEDELRRIITESSEPHIQAIANNVLQNPTVKRHCQDD